MTKLEENAGPTRSLHLIILKLLLLFRQSRAFFFFFAKIFRYAPLDWLVRRECAINENSHRQAVEKEKTIEAKDFVGSRFRLAVHIFLIVLVFAFRECRRVKVCHNHHATDWRRDH